MSTTAAPYGLRPVNLIGGQPYAGSTRLIKIASGTATNLFFGQPVTISADGVVVAATVTTTVPATGVVGVFVGCSYTDPNLNIPVYKQYWPTGTVASDAVAYVVDDPDIVMQVQADDTVPQTALGANISLNAASGSTSTGNSTTSADVAGIAVTATLPLRIVGFVNGPDSAVGDAFTDILVKFNAPNVTGSVVAGGHSYLNPTGI
jgi:hypothetical protein